MHSLIRRDIFSTYVFHYSFSCCPSSFASSEIQAALDGVLCLCRVIDSGDESCDFLLRVALTAFVAAFDFVTLAFVFANVKLCLCSTVMKGGDKLSESTTDSGDKYPTPQ